jgi:hypothetical protein
VLLLLLLMPPGLRVPLPLLLLLLQTERLLEALTTGAEPVMVLETLLQLLKEPEGLPLGEGACRVALSPGDADTEGQLLLEAVLLAEAEREEDTVEHTLAELLPESVVLRLPEVQPLTVLVPTGLWEPEALDTLLLLCAAEAVLQWLELALREPEPLRLLLPEPVELRLPEAQPLMVLVPQGLRVPEALPRLLLLCAAEAVLQWLGLELREARPLRLLLPEPHMLTVLLPVPEAAAELLLLRELVPLWVPELLKLLQAVLLMD